MKGHSRNYDYHSKRRDWRKDRMWSRLKVWTMLIVGLALAWYIAYLAATK